MRQVALAEAKIHLDQLIQKMNESSEEVLITENSKPIARILPFKKKRHHRQAGSAKGLFEIPDNFEAPIEDFAEHQ